MRIMMVADEPASWHEIQALLDSADGITAVEQRGGPQIVDWIQELRPDLILLDMDAGVSYSPDVVSTIRQQYPDVKIVILSGPGQEDRVLHALRNGANGHLTKGTSDREQFIAALQAVGRGDSILSPAMAGMILDEMADALRRT
jgi:two-component system response regulator DegU